MARKRKGRLVNGVILVDKYSGESSNHILQQVKRCFGAAKAGHTGALDPLATGMLPICLGEATKFSQFLLEADKTYVTTAKLGERTDTSDSDGTIVETRQVEVSLDTIEAVLNNFRGAIKQVPSMFSALKHNGKPLYSYARQGIEIERVARDITIISLKLLRFQGDELSLEVHCSKGTYIRSLVDDIGQQLGCGAHVKALRRTQVADYPSDKMISVDDLQALSDDLPLINNNDDDSQAPNKDFTSLDGLLLPMDTAVKELPAVYIGETSHRDFVHGQAISCNEKHAEGQSIRVYLEQDKLFLGMGVVDSRGHVQPKRVIVY